MVKRTSITIEEYEKNINTKKVNNKNNSQEKKVNEKRKFLFFLNELW